MTQEEQVDQIKALPPVRRVAGYLCRLAALAEVGATLRTTHQSDDEWNDVERKMYEDLVALLDPWAAALSPEEADEVDSSTVCLSALCRGEWPV